jgi:hypothetical protein
VVLFIQLTGGATRTGERSQSQAAIYSHSKVGDRLWKKLVQLLVSGLRVIVVIVGRGSFGTRDKGESTGRKAKRERENPERARERERREKENPERESPEGENPER